jgi:hypothetical protein
MRSPLTSGKSLYCQVIASVVTSWDARLLDQKECSPWLMRVQYSAGPWLPMRLAVALWACTRHGRFRRAWAVEELDGGGSLINHSLTITKSHCQPPTTTPICTRCGLTPVPAGRGAVRSDLVRGRRAHQDVPRAVLPWERVW